MRISGGGLFSGSGLLKGMCTLLIVLVVSMGSAFSITETVTSIAPAGTLDLLVWYEFDMRFAGTASILDLTGAGGDLENNQPLPVGAVQLTTGPDNQDKAEIGVNLPPDFPAFFLFPEVELNYSYHKANVGAPAPAPSLKITLWNPACPSGVDCFGTLVYEPYLQGAGNPPTDTWTDVTIDGNTGSGDGPGVGGFWWTGGFGQPNGFAGPPYQSLNEWSAAFNADFNGAIAVVLSIGVGSYNQDQVGYFDRVRLAALGSEIIWDFEAPVPCEPDPLSQGYWHRQCLGVAEADGGIDPGRNGRGPQSPTEPDFEKTLMPAVSFLLDNLVYESQTCQGMDAVPASDSCQRAIKQFTALLLNLQSGRIQQSCGVDAGCGASTIPELIGSLAALINSGECDAAAACAAAVNEGNGNLEAGTLETVAVASAVNETTFPISAEKLELAASASAAAEAVVEPTTTMDESAAYLVLPSESPRSAEVVEVKPVMELDDDDMIQRHLAVLGNASAPAAATDRSRNALFTVLSGGYDAALRLEVAEALALQLDPAFHELLSAHLEDIRQETLESGLEDLSSRAELLLNQLDATE